MPRFLTGILLAAAIPALAAVPGMAQTKPRPPAPAAAATPLAISPEIMRLTAAANAGDADAALTLGQDYLDGKGVPHDPAAGYQWIRQAARGGLVAAQVRMGQLEESGNGTAPDPADAANWYRLAAQRGAVAAMFRLGEIYRLGIGVNADPAEAARWYQPAAEHRDLGSEVALGRLYRDGTGVPASRDQASKWFTAAALGGSAEGRTQLAQLLLGDDQPKDAPPPPSPDTRQAIDLLEQAVAQGYAPAELRLGLAHLNGIEAGLDPSEAARLIHDAADQGDPDAGRTLGMLYEQGQGMKRDLVAAFTWLDIAAGLGDSKAAIERDKISGSLSPPELQAAHATEQQWRKGVR